MGELEQVVTRKEENDDLYLVQLPDLTVIVKPLSLKRAQVYKQLIGDGTDILLGLEIEEAILRESIVEATPAIDLNNFEEVGRTKAGLIGTIARIVLKLSIYGSIEEINYSLQFTRPLARTPEAQLKLLICAAFKYKPDELDGWTWNKIIYNACLAEVFLSGQLQATTFPIQFLSADAQPSKQKGLNLKAENKKVMAEN